MKIDKVLLQHIATAQLLLARRVVVRQVSNELGTFADDQSPSTEKDLRKKCAKFNILADALLLRAVDTILEGME